MPPIDGTIQQVTSNVALTTTEAQVAQFTVPQPANLQSRTTPWAVVEVAIPNVTGLAAGASVTINIRAGTTSSGTLIGSATGTNTGAGANAVGGISAMAAIPATTEGAIYVGALVSSGTGTAVASATAPILIATVTYD
jgi:hypothetical protein